MGATWMDLSSVATCSVTPLHETPRRGSFTQTELKCLPGPEVWGSAVGGRMGTAVGAGTAWAQGFLGGVEVL